MLTLINHIYANHMKALIIDDEIDICFLLSGILRNTNIDSVYVNSLGDARKALETEFPEIIFIDNHLPDGMGVDFINYIKKTKPESKIVMITAYDTQKDRIKATQAGVDYFIAKPFTRESIYKTVGLMAN
jgi:two-component system, OmpR family, response regulator